MNRCCDYGISCVFVRHRLVIAERQDRMLNLESTTTNIVTTLSTLTGVVDGWKLDQEKLVSKVNATADNLAQLQKEMVQLRSEVVAESSKRVYVRSRSPLHRCCYCSIVRFDRKTDNKLQKGDSVWLVPRPGASPTLKRYVVAANGRFSQLSTDKAGRVRCGERVCNEELFIKSGCHICSRRS